MRISDTRYIVFSVCATDHFERREVGMKAKYGLYDAYISKVLNLFLIC